MAHDIHFKCATVAHYLLLARTEHFASQTAEHVTARVSSHLHFARSYHPCDMLSGLGVRARACLFTARRHLSPTQGLVTPAHRLQQCRRLADRCSIRAVGHNKTTLRCLPRCYTGMPAAGERAGPPCLWPCTCIHQVGLHQFHGSCCIHKHAATSTTGCVAGMQDRDSLVLGIESSCDDTGVAVVRASDGAILGQAITGQVPLPSSAQHKQQPAHHPALYLPL